MDQLSFIPAELILKKRAGLAHQPDEMKWFIQAYSDGIIPDYQMAAWAMAVWFRGMDDAEVSAFTSAMLNSGSKFNFSNLNAPRIDKHSTGGVGDKTSLIIGPILAAAEVFTPMIAGRGLGHTGGTIDKLESIPGFRANLSKQEFETNVAEHFFSIMCQSEDICPADRKFYALRDVTATIDSLPLICGSIMSKKLCEDLTGLVLDVKFGSGAFIQELSQARELAKLLISTGKSHGLNVSALLTNMNQPLGRFAGNALEVYECVEILEGKTFTENGRDYYEPVRDLSLQLSAHMLVLANKAQTLQEGLSMAGGLLESGRALSAFRRLLEYQGPAQLDQMPKAKYSYEFTAEDVGYIHSIDTQKLGWTGVALGAGRRRSSDRIDVTAGLEFLCCVGDRVEKGQPLVRLFATEISDFTTAVRILRTAFVFGNAPLKSSLPLVAEVLT